MRKTAIAVLVSMTLAACAGDDTPPAKAPPPPVLTATPPPAPSASAAEPKAEAPPPVAKKTPEELQALAPAAIADAVNQHDAKRVAALFADEAVVTIFGRGDYHGREAIAEEQSNVCQGYPDVKLGFARTWSKGKTLVGEWTLVGTNSGAVGQRRATNRQIGITGVSVYTFDDAGLIASEHRYWDVGGVMAQLGLSRAPARPLAVLPLATEAHVAKGTDAEEKAVTWLKGMFGAFESKKEANFLALVSDDSTFSDNLAPAETKGKKDASNFFAMYTKGFPDAKTSVTKSLAVEDFVIAEYTFAGTKTGAAPGVKPANRPFTVHGIDIVQTKDGKISHAFTYQNGKELLEQIGQWREPGPAEKAAEPSGTKKPAK